jgi:hypothetical protein
VTTLAACWLVDAEQCPPWYRLALEACVAWRGEHNIDLRGVEFETWKPAGLLIAVTAHACVPGAARMVGRQHALGRTV